MDGVWENGMDGKRWGRRRDESEWVCVPCASRRRRWRHHEGGGDGSKLPFSLRWVRRVVMDLTDTRLEPVPNVFPPASTSSSHRFLNCHPARGTTSHDASSLSISLHLISFTLSHPFSRTFTHLTTPWPVARPPTANPGRGCNGGEHSSSPIDATRGSSRNV